MKNILLSHKIHSFMKMKENQMPELKDKSIDQMIEDLVTDGRNLASY
jgi:hypothetical protein